MKYLTQPQVELQRLKVNDVPEMPSQMDRIAVQRNIEEMRAVCDGIYISGPALVRELSYSIDIQKVRGERGKPK